MVAAGLELDHCFALIATLPTFFAGKILQLGKCRIVWTLLGAWVELATAGRAGLHVTAGALRVRLACTAITVLGVLGPDPGTARFSRAVNPVFGFVFEELAVEALLEITVEKVLDGGDWNGLIVVAAFGWHLSWIGERGLEDHTDAPGAPGVTTWERDDPGSWKCLAAREAVKGRHWFRLRGG